MDNLHPLSPREDPNGLIYLSSNIEVIETTFSETYRYHRSFSLGWSLGFYLSIAYINNIQNH